jgi:RNA polymerase sigma factor (sigma-70 family)
MPEQDDHQLLAEFVREGSESAFSELVRRYVALVYSTALRFSSNPHHAEEITQAVFIILARKAGTLSSRVVLSGWLYQAARLTAANFVKGEIRRARREQEVYMQSTLPTPEPTDWDKIAPLLDQAMGRLGETDRNALVLRFFENRTSAEIGSALRMDEDTARRRVNRALEKLRKIFSAHGVDSTAETIAGAISANSIQVVPAAVATSVTAAAVAKGTAASTSTLTLIKGALKIMAWSQAKTVVVIGIGVVLVAATSTVALKTIAYQSQRPNPSPISSPASPFMDRTKQVSPFTMVKFDSIDSNHVTVMYQGAEYQLMAVDGLSVTNILDFCRQQYGQSRFGEPWAEKRFAEDLVAVLSDMGQPVNTENTINLSLVDLQTGQQQTIAAAAMTAANRAAVIHGRATANSNLPH